MQGRSAMIMTLWAVVLLELVLPVPGVLTLGAIYVLLVRPPWFPQLIDRIYADSNEG